MQAWHVRALSMASVQVQVPCGTVLLSGLCINWQIETITEQLEIKTVLALYHANARLADLYVNSWGLLMRQLINVIKR